MFFHNFFSVSKESKSPINGFLSNWKINGRSPFDTSSFLSSSSFSKGSEHVVRYISGYSYTSLRFMQNKLCLGDIWISKYKIKSKYEIHIFCMLWVLSPSLSGWSIFQSVVDNRWIQFENQKYFQYTISIIHHWKRIS